MSLKQEEKHLPILIAICFVGNFVFGGIGQACSPDSFVRVFSWQWSSLLFMAGASLYAAKLHTDKWHISSAGFILMTIGQGIIFTLHDSNATQESQALFATAVMAFFPGMVFLYYYSGFPVWLRIAGLVAMLPFLVCMIKIDMKTYTVEHDMWLSVSGFILLQLVSICWGYFVLRPYDKTTIQQE